MKKSKFLIPILSLVMGSLAHAAPYASMLTNNAGTISFRLNEAAGSVKVIWNGGATNKVLGARSAGVTTTNLGISGPFFVQVFRAAAGGYTQISSDTDNLVKFNSPRGLAVNTNPATATFGRIYVANSAAGTALTRAVGDGIYMLNSDLTDALAKGNTASTAGIDFGTGGAADPQKIGVGPDGKLYVNLFSTAKATTWVVDPDVSGSYATNVLEGLGENTNPTVHSDSANTPLVFGSLSTSNLVLYNIDGNYTPGGFNRILRWDIGAGPLPYNAAPSLVGGSVYTSSADLNCDLTFGSDGKLYTIVNRSSGTDTDSLRVYDTDLTTVLWGSIAQLGSPDPLRQIRAIDYYPYGNYLAAIHDTNWISIIPLVNGLPDFNSITKITNNSLTTIGRDVAFDIAGNVYAVSSGQSLLRVFSVGGTTTMTTGSDGTFTRVVPNDQVTVSADISDASESGPVAGSFTITRTNTASALTVFFTAGGTATPTNDYLAITNALVIGAGSNSVSIAITPVNDSISELTESVNLTLTGDPSYTVGSPGSATVVIIDNDQPEASISTFAPTAYEGTAGDYVTYQLTRAGETNVDITVNVAYSGTAAGTSYSGPASVLIPSGVVNQTFNVFTFGDNIVNGDRTIIATVTAGSGYNVATNNSATATLLDDDLGVETRILFSDNFETTNQVAGYITRFGAANNIEDWNSPTITGGPFCYDTANEFPPISAAPGSATTLALKLTANKYESTSLGGAAGVNVYPTNVFSGDYAVRFNMYIQLNSDATLSTEFALFGINHSGAKTNWFRDSTAVVPNANLPKDCDGLWFAIVADASGLGDYEVRTGNGAANGSKIILNRFATELEKVFKAPPYSLGDTSSDAHGGSPCNEPSSSSQTWTDVEVKQVNNVVTLTMNRTVIYSFTNTTGYTSGKIMFGYDDAYDGGGDKCAVFYDNVRVIDLTVAYPNVTAVQKVGSNIQIDFVGTVGDLPAAYTVLGASTLSTSSASYTTEAGQSIVSLGTPGTFRATVPMNGSTRFYRIKR